MLRHIFKTPRVTHRVQARTQALFSSWEGGYAPDSIEARVNRPRKRVKPSSIHAVPPKAEEDMWFDAQAPGYQVDRSNEPNHHQKERWRGHELWDGNQGKDSRRIRAQPLHEHATAKFEHRTTPGIVRSSTTTANSEDDLDALVREYNTTVVAAYQHQPGFRFAQLWIDRNELQVTSVTGWDSNAALLQATKDPSYAKAMQNIAAFVNEKPMPVTMELAGETSRSDHELAGSRIDF
eukprot:gb/GECG01008891.1/.p1 GENE.gb/GECG01008891.1/~~gb/GECG01008891.1/.p1  ORF type:complete len:236 (+),score=29.65 gb/GECG01008891.1/:1-708(+)